MNNHPYLSGIAIGLVSMAVAVFGGYACGDAAEAKKNAATPATMTFEECQASAEYPGGRYAVEFDKGVCTVQKP